MKNRIVRLLIIVSLVMYGSVYFAAKNGVKEYKSDTKLAESITMFIDSTNIVGGHLADVSVSNNSLFLKIKEFEDAFINPVNPYNEAVIFLPLLILNKFHEIDNVIILYANEYEFIVNQNTINKYIADRCLYTKQPVYKFNPKSCTIDQLRDFSAQACNEKSLYSTLKYTYDHDYNFTN